MDFRVPTEIGDAAAGLCPCIEEPVGDLVRSEIQFAEARASFTTCNRDRLRTHAFKLVLAIAVSSEPLRL